MELLQEPHPEYHCRDVWDDGGNVIGYELMLDENDEPVPLTICICHAFEPNECVCGAWDDVTDWEYD